MPNSVLPDLPGPVALACHDAGAANLVFSWIAAEADSQPDFVDTCRLLARGAAAGLWPGYHVSGLEQCSDITELLEGASTLVAGTGWASYLEFEAIRLARDLGIHTIAVVDHWTNYRDRFRRDGDEVLPDEIWVADADAWSLATNEFKGIQVTQLPNTYLENTARRVRSIEHTNNDRCHILYLLEPIRGAWGKEVGGGEFEALDFFINNLQALGLGESPIVRLRPHPSDASGKYDRWIGEQTEQNIAIDDTPDLAESLAWSDAVVGCQTYAMVVALAAGKKVFSAIPPWAPPCILPQKDIINITDLLT